MAKSKRKSIQKKRRTQRRFERISNYSRMLSELNALDIQDNRRYRPKIKGIIKYDLDTIGKKARTALSTETIKSRPYRGIQHRQRFVKPDRSLVCIRRKARRQSLFANNRIGKGKSGPKFRKMTESSKVRC